MKAMLHAVVFSPLSYCKHDLLFLLSQLSSLASMPLQLESHPRPIQIHLRCAGEMPTLYLQQAVLIGLSI